MTPLQQTHRAIIQLVEGIAKEFQLRVVASGGHPDWFIMRLSGGCLWFAASARGQFFGYVVIREPAGGLQLATELDIIRWLFEEPVNVSGVARHLAEDFTAEQVSVALDPLGASEPPEEYPVLGGAVIYLDEIMRAKASMRNN